MQEYASRIVGIETITPDGRAAHPENWQTHPDSQKEALRGILAEIGIVDVMLGYRSPNFNIGKVTILDGHLRDEVAPQPWPVLILDISDDEARYLLATHDTVANMSVAIPSRVAALLAKVSTQNDGVNRMFAAIRAGNEKLLDALKPTAYDTRTEAERLAGKEASFSVFPDPEELTISKQDYFDATKLVDAGEVGTYKQTYLVYVSFSDEHAFRRGLSLLTGGARNESRDGMTMASLDGDGLLPFWEEFLPDGTEAKE